MHQNDACFTPCSSVSIVNFEHISHFALVFLLLTLNLDVWHGPKYTFVSCPGFIPIAENTEQKDVLFTRKKCSHPFVANSGAQKNIKIQMTLKAFWSQKLLLQWKYFIKVWDRMVNLGSGKIFSTINQVDTQPESIIC